MEIYRKYNLFIIIFFLCCSSCTKIHTHGSKAPIPEKEPIKERVYFTYGLKSKKAEESGDVYIVKTGDTLSSIAFLYDINYLTIAKWNNIKKPYKINVGDEIIIKSNKYRKSSVKSKSKVKFASNIKWTRPHNGRVSKNFSYSDIGKKGIDISGNIGDDIYSAANGIVVYSGSGIKGYGNLIIIKHNDVFLSAYAHTQAILVKEGTFVKKGQIIAKLGDTDSVKPILHFQIRKNGKSIDPEKYIP